MNNQKNNLNKAITALFGVLLISSLIYFVFNISIILSISQGISTPWYIARAAGIASYILMFLVIILGTGMTTGYIYKYINPVKAWVIHKYLSISLSFTLLAHIISLTFDRFINFSWLDVLIPFSSTFKPLFLSFGIFGFYTLIVIIVSSLLFRIKYKKTWRGIHYAVYPLFIFSFIHGTFIGTDSKTIGMQIIYWGTGLVFLGLILYRFLFKKIIKH
jgi:predicted ferric reductase